MGLLVDIQLMGLFRSPCTIPDSFYCTFSYVLNRTQDKITT